MFVDSLSKNYSTHNISEKFIEKWQLLLNSVANLFNAPAALIMRVHKDEIEVFVRSATKGNPYSPGETEKLNMGLYCETVMANQEILEVPNALEDPDWNNNPDIKLNMISYLGLPLIWPDGSVFGTICVLDSQRRNFQKRYRELFYYFKDIIESDFRVFTQNEDLKTMNKELNDSKTHLAEANKELEAFSYSVSHDIQTPLRQITGLSQILSDSYSDILDERGRKILADMESRCDKMKTMVESFLQLSTASKASIEKNPVNLYDLVKSIIEDLQSSHKDRTVEFKVENSLHARGDAKLLKIVLANLIGNAWKFTSKTEKAVIEVGSLKNDSETTYFVKDNGVGFDQENAKKLFSPFQRLHSDKDFEGTGIGLATVQRIINRHGGEIRAEGKPGEGSTFYFTLGG